MVEQLIRNQQVRGSTPRAGSSEIKGLANMANPSFLLCETWCVIFLQAVCLASLFIFRHGFPLSFTDRMQINLGGGPVLMAQDALDRADGHIGPLQD